MKVVDVQSIHKKFCADFKRSLAYAMVDIGSELFGIKNENDQLRKKEFWALKDVSFSLEQGKSIGLIGSNGAGKTTLLRMISGLIKPDKGSISVTSSIAPLIALGAGFNPLLTGRENIFVNMSILGLTATQIKSRFDEVVEFAELGHALDMPVQSYSSGMAARLGFACAILTTPELLIIDEVLAVGDVKFRAKCYRKLAELKKSGTSFILVSHNSQTILSVCEEAVYLKKGVLEYKGPAHEGITRYEAALFGKEEAGGGTGKFLQEKRVAEKSVGIDLIEVCLSDSNNDEVPFMHVGVDHHIRMRFFAHADFNDVGVALLIRDANGENAVSLFADSRSDAKLYNVKPGYFEITYRMQPCVLKSGLYSVKLNINQDNIMVFDSLDTYKFNVVSDDRTLAASSLYQPRSWNMKSIQMN